MKLHTLLQSLHPLAPFEFEDVEVTSIENDNRKVTKGSLFVCVKGYTVDGHQFAASAVQNGAVAILAEKPLDLPVPVIVVTNTVRAMAVLGDAFYSHPTQKLHLIGITGTNGKTTTSHLIEKIFADFGKKTGLIGTMYTKIGNQMYETKNTTPESLTLQKLFKQMVDEKVEVAVMEVSSHALDLGRVHGCAFDTAVFTNLTQDHLDYHQTMAEYKRAKGLLFSQLGNAFSDHEPKFAILNVDDEATKMYEKSTAAHVISYGIDLPADISARNISMNAGGTTFELVTPLGASVVTTKLVGKFNVYNVLASIAVALVYRIPLKQIIESIEAVQGVPGRMELVDEGQSYAVIVDYAHTPDSLENVLKTIGQFANERIYVIVGCGGDRDRTKRPLMAQIAVKYGTNPIFTSDNPRSEDPLAILKDMEAGVSGETYQVIVDRKEAIHFAVKAAKPGDIILIAGKGHETYQQIGNQILAFDDRLVAKEAIKGESGCI
ncbi:UDP-N-acetylmuramoyl-L-alanyl-D-glutamate--2,6-diaminopimelate ligase [Bacillus sp. DNRA2]|uniref:UDP-N-acetylmuramoyl-L-alanyl-D-glutamate--2, 6-diaminopimelate ligase n=1 Tax=Bacillus sp. DNRA2 TaxID=2723053 RepID=UPI00145C65A7|nr:UDP-N-acetylmuramoyl-L-alanyl-D-glutamate--2,6-diaminopimelate ligase [Bacillus sp. DNRA2]NMD69406.1 UDP-N-acetylmuramoyl-L-alanyl-D-glutamate--2,6-diaminopimelate ligase [Bacillus sp. DNRA2]